MSQIFISYRRDDTGGYARAIYQHLVAHFGPSMVFMDLESMQPGLDFPSQLEQGISSAKLMLVLIGKDWTGNRDASGARINDQSDFVRQEVVRGLQREIPVVPILLGNASLPQDGELPDELKPLTRRHAITVTHPRFVADMEPVILLASKELGLASGFGRIRHAITHWARILRTPIGVFATLCFINALLLFFSYTDVLLTVLSSIEVYYGLGDFDAVEASAGAVGTVRTSTGIALGTAVLTASIRRFSQIGLGTALRLAGMAQLLVVLGEFFFSLVAPFRFYSSITNTWMCVFMLFVSIALLLGARTINSAPFPATKDNSSKGIG